MNAEYVVVQIAPKGGFEVLKPKKHYLLDIKNSVYRNNHYLAFHRNLSFS